jgi:hypothetical protein
MEIKKGPDSKIHFEVSIEEANKIFKALGNLPFVEVYELIGKLNDQANNQLTGGKSSPRTFVSDSSFNLEDLIK